MAQEPAPNPEAQRIAYQDNLPTARIAKSGIARIAFWAALCCAGMVFTIGTGPNSDGWILAAVFAAIPVLLGVTGLRDVHRRRVRGLPSCIVAILLGLCCVPVVVHVAYGPSRRDLTYIISCRANLRVIGQSLGAYVAAFGEWPETLGDLNHLPAAALSPTALVCPCDDRWRSAVPAATLPPTYLYLRPVEKSPNPAAVVLIEPPLHHDRTLMNVLYSDGSVSDIRDGAALQTFAALASPTPQTQPATTRP